MRRLGGVVGSALVLAVGAGCAGGGNDNSPKGRYVAKVNAICRAGNFLRGKAFYRLGRHPDPEKARKVVMSVAVPSIQHDIDAVRRVPPPPGDRALLRRMLDLAQADLDRVRRNPLLQVGPKDQFADFARIAHRYGLNECDPPPD